MAASVTCLCRGLRKWCDRRCEQSCPDFPAGYPATGFYCSLHSYQKPRQNADGSLTFESAEIEQHTRRRTSFVSPESVIAAELVKSPLVVRDRGAGAPKTASGAAIIEWLGQARKLEAAAAIACAGRMIAQEILIPVDGPRMFQGTKEAFYRVHPQGPQRLMG
jgi:hypothetical protein